ncbi:hypothetical protein BDZ94DRAFT_305413 [Collybia nuda]|uniref:T6SS Phospholipase effector Tle1-like catalytic domain-containing protein n=1 Tax=Collybia nuda TaxID=64659 RepID=A0A9P5YC84_9AGAR|nr:hypothetical protein BDZ94DRAFT_305413 [Collybia nuda]
MNSGTRRMVIACDGTGQSASREIKPTTNVIRFCHALSTDFSSTSHRDIPAQQMIFYQSGIGTAASGIIHDAYAEGTGLGIDDNVLDAYTFIMNNYIQDDELYIFGFSRGAFTARVLAGLIVQLGIFKTTHLTDFKNAFKAYRTSEDEWKNYLDFFHKELERDRNSGKEPRTRKTTIQVVGCWDTVGSVGLPMVQPIIGRLRGSSGVYDPSLLGNSSSRCFAEVQHAFHALALDECRRPFSPTLWYLPKTSNTVLEQCWFAGAHSNVGGGYADTALSDLALAWMIDRCSPYLTFDRKELQNICHLHRNPKPKIILQPPKDENYDEKYQEWSKGLLHDSYKRSSYALQLQGWRYRRPGEYGDKEGADGHSDRTFEVMHASVRERWNARNELKVKWKPESLSGLVPRESAPGEWEWFKAGKWGSPDLIIKEAPIKKGSLEAQLRNGS